MSVQVLVSTMNESDPIHLYRKMNISSNAVIVNQCGYDKQEKLSVDNHQIKYFCCDAKGLSKSRNMAIAFSNESDIALLADDDLIYVDNYIDIVRKAFNDNPEYDIIRFQVEGINKPFKRYGKKSKNIRFLSSLKTSSVEIAFRPEKIKNAGIGFNELFGAGSEYKMGEENIFLFECLRRGFRMKYIPIKIANLYVGDSSWFSGFNNKYFFDRGAIYAAMTKRYSLILILQFAVRHYKQYQNVCSLSCAIKEMLKGRNIYLSSLGEREN